MAGDEPKTFTFDDLSSLLRTEKDSGILTPVRKDLYPAMADLQDKQNKECEAIFAAGMDDIKFDIANEKKKKIVQLIKNVVEFRMQKVASMALKNAMGMMIPVDSLPPEERLFYEETLESAKKLWACRMKKEKKITYPDLAPELNPVIPAQPEIIVEKLSPIAEKAFADPVSETEPKKEEVQEIDDMSDIYIPEEVLSESQAVIDIPPISEEELGEISAEPVPAAGKPAETERTTAEEPEEDGSENNPYADSDDLITIRMVETLPMPLSGLNRNYSLRKEDVVRMPECIASVLIRKNLAVKISI